MSLQHLFKTCLQEGVFHNDVLKGHVAEYVLAFSKTNHCQELTEQMNHLIRILKCLSLDPAKVKYTKCEKKKQNNGKFTEGSIYSRVVINQVIRDLKIPGRGRRRVQDLTWSLFTYSQNIDFREASFYHISLEKLATISFSEGSYAFSQSQNF